MSKTLTKQKEELTKKVDQAQIDAAEKTFDIATRPWDANRLL